MLRRIIPIIVIATLVFSPMLPDTIGHRVQAAVRTIEAHPNLLAIFPRDQYEYINRLLTEVQKGNILNLIRNIVLDYIKGSAGNCPAYLQPVFGFGGQELCPKFVTNWQTLFFGEKRTADLRLNQEVASANIPAHQKQALQALTEAPTTDYGTRFDQMFLEGRSCENYNPVSQLLCESDPGNSLGEGNMEVKYYAWLTRRQELRDVYVESKKAEAIAGQGYTGTQQCLEEVEDPSIGGRKCLRPLVTKPGKLDQEVQAHIETSDIDRIVNAFNLEALLANLINMFINRLLQQEFDGILGLLGGRGPLQPGQTPFPPLPTPSPAGAIQIMMTANPQTIESGGSSVLSWSATNASTCTASGSWSGPRATSGSELVSPPSTSTYTLTCSDAYGGQAFQSITITVTGGGGGGNEL